MKYCFLGPSIPEHNLSVRYPSITFLPPAKACDIDKLFILTSSYTPTHILLIDGLYFSELAIRHKEIIAAIARGVKIYSSSSMGALRAAELESFGMRGLGRIFKYYCSEIITSDDEVAVIHNPSPPFEAFTIPLINLRFCLDDLVRNHIFTIDFSKQLLDQFSQIHFSNRNFDSLKSICDDTTFNIISSSLKDYKSIDALESLDYLENLSVTNSEQNTKSDFTIGYYHYNYFTDNFFPDTIYSKSTAHNKIDDFSSLGISVANMSNLVYNSLNRELTLRFARYLKIHPTTIQIQATSNFIKSRIKYHSNASILSTVLTNDPYFLDLLSLEEATLIILHLSILTRIDIPGRSKAIHLLLAKYSLSGDSPLSSSSHEDTNYRNDFIDLLTHFTTSSDAHIDLFL